MTTEQFIYWLQGFAEISGEVPSIEEWQVIKDHLALVFEKKTPNKIGTLTTNFPQGGFTNHEYLKPILPTSRVAPTIIC